MGNGEASFEILVTPEFLKEKARILEELLRKAVNGYRNAGEMAAATNSCFQGRCADRMRKRIIKNAQEGAELMEEMLLFSGNLLLIAEEYTAAERENKDVADRN